MDVSAAHATLGVDATTPIGEVRTRYRMRAQMLHPDRVGSDSPQLAAEAQRAMAELNEAWMVVSDAERAGTRRPQRSGRPSPGPSTQTTRRNPVEGECDLCGSSPAARINLRSTTGMVLARRDIRMRPDLCRRCGTSMFREVQADTLAKGWWGLIAAFVNVGNVVANIWAVRRHRALLPEPAYRDPRVDTPLPPGLPLAKPVMLRSKPAIALAVVVLLIAGFSTEFDPTSTQRPSTATTADQRDEADPVGTCLDRAGYEIDCSDPDAGYEIVFEATTPDGCGPYRERFDSQDGRMFCAVTLP